VLNDYRSIPKLLADAAARVGRQALRGWEIE